jgi:hypothetical protein
MFGITKIPVVGPGLTHVPRESQSTTTTSSIIRTFGGSLKYIFIFNPICSTGGCGGEIGGEGETGGIGGLYGL